MNEENLRKLKAFFDDGAPHFHLDMRVPFGAADRSDMTRYINSPVPENCGSAGCIAGAAYMLFEESPDPHMHLVDQWDTVCPKALRHLGLPNEGDEFFGHPLFDQNLAPEGCTAQQAAAAIENVLKGEFPWPISTE